MSQSFTISRLRPEAAAEIVPLMRAVQDLHVAHVPERFHSDASDTDLRAFLTEWLGREAIAGFVARDGHGTALGYAIAEIHTRAASPFQHAMQFGELHHISVAEAAQRNGIGRALIQAVKAHLRSNGVGTLRAVHYGFNTASAALMEAEGMVAMSVAREGVV